MISETIQQLIIAIFYVATMIYYSRKVGKIERRLIQQEQVYLKSFTEATDLLGVRYVRFLRRAYFLQVCDWGYARRTHGELLGLSFIIPSTVLENSAQVLTYMYFTDEEMEAVREGYNIMMKDQRTRELCKEFIVQ